MAELKHLEIEPKWQKKWQEADCFHAVTGSKKPKFYCLVEFPYPSGQGCLLYTSDAADDIALV